MLKYNLIVPMAGKGQRMIDGGYKFPKPLIMAGDRTIIEHGLDSIDTMECQLIFVVRREHVQNWSIDKFLTSRYPKCHIIVAEKETGGSVDSCYLATSLIDNDMPLIIFTSDVKFSPRFKPIDEVFSTAGFLLTFKANSDRYSYVQQDLFGFVTRTAEKVVISKDANAGVYCFKKGSTFCRLAEASLAQPGEHYLAPLYNLLIASGGKVTCMGVDQMYIMGTPDELRFFETVVYPYTLPRGFILCSDHSGFEAKEWAKNAMITVGPFIGGPAKAKWSPPIIDVGCYSDSDCDYADYIARAVKLREYYPGYLILGFCRSGQGVNICANKYPELRAVLVDNAPDAAKCVGHNAANFFALPAGRMDPSHVAEIMEAIFHAEFEGGRHQNRLQKLEK